MSEMLHMIKFEVSSKRTCGIFMIIIINRIKNIVNSWYLSFLINLNFLSFLIVRRRSIEFNTLISTDKYHRMYIKHMWCFYKSWRLPSILLMLEYYKAKASKLWMMKLLQILKNIEIWILWEISVLLKCKKPTNFLLLKQLSI